MGHDTRVCLHPDRAILFQISVSKLVSGIYLTQDILTSQNTNSLSEYIDSSGQCIGRGNSQVGLVYMYKYYLVPRQNTLTAVSI